jgi:GDP-4-dehydro-6-deoxy-D-mannose reductase
MGKVLVTGASGLLGRRIVPLLREQGSEVVTSGRHDRENPVDVTRPGALTTLVESIGPDVVVHLAGGVAQDDENTWELNLVPGIELLLASVRTSRPFRLVLIGSAAEYGAAGEQVTEETPTDPRSDYGRAKNVQTITALKAHEAGVEVLVLRPFNIVAPELPPTNALGNLRAQVIAGRTADPCVVRCGRLDVVRDFVTADFVAQVLARCLEAWPKTPVLNVGSGQGIVLRDIFDAFGSALGIRLAYRPDPALVAIAAPDRMTADPTALEAATGLRCRVDPHLLALTLIGPGGSLASVSGST